MKDFKVIKWGMFITKFLRSVFERQIEEAVSVSREAESHSILNSRSEGNQCALPRLTTRMGDMGEEVKKWEKEWKEEKDREDRIEEKIRNMRKVLRNATFIRDFRVGHNNMRPNILCLRINS